MTELKPEEIIFDLIQEKCQCHTKKCFMSFQSNDPNHYIHTHYGYFHHYQYKYKQALKYLIEKKFIRSEELIVPFDHRSLTLQGDFSYKRDGLYDD